MRPWMLQGLAVGCLLTAAAAVVQKEASRVPAERERVSGGTSFERSGGSSTGGALAKPKLPSKVRGRAKDESYASRMRTRLEEGEFVTVGGQVNAPGPVLVGPSATLRSVIEKAGGVTPFAASNRVRLTRGTECKEYNLKGNGQDVPVEPKDTIEVPQKTVIGR